MLEYHTLTYKNREHVLKDSVYKQSPSTDTFKIKIQYARVCH